MISDTKFSSLKIIELRHKKKQHTAQLICIFVFATQIVRYLFFFSPKFQAFIFCDCTGLFVWELVGNPKDRFSHDRAQLFYFQHYEHLVLPVWFSNSRDPDQYGVCQYCVPALTFIAQNQWTETGNYSICLKIILIINMLYW